MKKVFLSMVLMFVSAVAYSQGVIGKWVTEGGDSQVEIYQNGDQLCGKIVWLKKGDGQLDVHNPDKSMQSRKLIGVNILTGLKLWLEGNNLKVRGYVAMFYETQTWTKK